VSGPFSDPGIAGIEVIGSLDLKRVLTPFCETVRAVLAYDVGRFLRPGRQPWKMIWPPTVGRRAPNAGAAPTFIMIDGGGIVEGRR